MMSYCIKNLEECEKSCTTVYGKEEATHLGLRLKEELITWVK